LLPHFYVVHEGKEFKLYKERDESEAAWVVAVQVNGKRWKRSMRTNDRAVASARVKAFLQMVAAGVDPDLGERWVRKGGDIRKLVLLANAGEWQEIEAFAGAAPKREVARFGRLFEEWPRLRLEMGETHRRNVANSVRRVLTAAGVEDIEKQAVTVWEPGLAARYFERKGAELSALGQGEQARGKFSANRNFEFALCFFKEVARARFAERGLWVPESVEAMEAAYRVHRFRKVGRSDYRAPRDEVVAATLAGWKSLPRDEAIAVGLMLAFGLRKAEVAQARRGWWAMVGGNPCLDSSRVVVKAGGGIIQVRGLEPFWSQLRELVGNAERGAGSAEHGKGSAEEYLVAPADQRERERAREVFENVSIWMRGLGWETQKTNHALRDYAGSQVAMRYGIYAASTWLRHAGVQVTEQHYTDFVKRHNVEPERVGVEWAVAEQAAGGKGGKGEGVQP
jgi:integrase